MLFVAMIFLIFALFVMVHVFRGYPAIWLGFILLTFGCCIIGLAGLIPRFGNYELNTALALPLDQPSWAWRIVGDLSLYDFMRFRLWSALGFVTAFAGFAYSYSFQHWKASDIPLLGIILAIDTYLIRSYDPHYLFKLFIKGTAFLGNSAEYARYGQQLHIRDAIALGLITIMLFWAVRRIFMVFTNSNILQKRVQALCVGVGSLLLAVFFVLLFCFGRSNVLNAYTMATSLLPLGAKYPVFNSFYVIAVPLVTVVAGGMVLLAIFRYGFLGTSRIGTKKLEQQINVANQAVRLALHSFKNRFLAAQMAMNMAAFQLEDLKDERAEKAMAQIKSATDVCGEALASLDKLHAQAKQFSVNPRWINLQELVEDALRNCSLDLAGVIITKRYLNNEISVLGDREHLTTVLENIFNNAKDAMSDHGENEEPAKLMIVIGLEYEWGYIRVIDNGIGISRKNLHKVFRPFFTTKPSKSNWGLGLTYCHRVIKSHRGFINLSSKAGIGTTVEIVLRCRENINAGTTFWKRFLFVLRKSQSSRSCDNLG